MQWSQRKEILDSLRSLRTSTRLSTSLGGEQLHFQSK